MSQRHANRPAYTPPPTPTDEAARQEAVDRLRLQNSAAAPRLQAVAEAVAECFDTPIALVTIIDGDRQVFFAKHGLGGAGTPRDVSFCGHAIADDSPVLVVPDASVDPRFAHNPLVEGAPDIVFYAGAVVKGPTGHNIGTVCVIDRQPRDFTEAERQALQAFAHWAELEILMHAANPEDRAAWMARATPAPIRTLERAMFWEISSDGLVIFDVAGNIVDANRRFNETFGFGPDDRMGHRIHAAFAGPDLDVAIRQWQELPDGGDAVRFVARGAAGDGTPAWYEWSLIRHDELCYARVADVTAAHVAADLQARFDTVLEQTAAGVVQIDADDYVRVWNAGMTRLFGDLASEVLNKPLHAEDRIMTTERDFLQRLRAEVAAKGVATAHGVPGRHADGHPVIFDYTAAPVPGAEGELAIVILDAAPRVAAATDAAWVAALVDQSAAGVCQIDVDGRIVAWNDKMEDLTGFDAAAMLGTLVTENPTTTEHTIAALAEMAPALARGETFAVRGVQIQHHDGRPSYLDASASPIVIDGDNRGTIFIATDATKRVLAELDQARLAAMVEQAAAGIAMMNSDGVITVWNKGLEEMLGYASKDLIGTVQRGFPGLTPEAHEALAGIEVAVARGEAAPIQGVPVERPDGTILYVDGTCSPVKGPSGGQGFMYVVTDATARVAAERDQAHLAAILEGSTDAVIAKQLDGTITAWNSAAEAMYGWTADEAIGRHIDFIVPDDKRGQLDQIMAAIRNGRVARVETRRRHRDGHEVDVELVVSPVHSANGELVGASSIARDITERQAMERLARRQAEHLDVDNRILREFGNLIAHDLREPLRALRVNLDRLRHEVGHPAIQEAQLGADRLADMLGGFAHVARIEPGSYDESVDLAAICADVCQDLHQAIQDSGARISQDELPAVRGNSAQLHLAMQNLIHNAIKYAGHAPRINIDAIRRNGNVRIRVADNGPGVPAAFRERIFDPFQRGERQGETGGTGMGLFTAGIIASRHGGRLGLEDSEQGATFYVEVPA